VCQQNMLQVLWVDWKYCILVIYWTLMICVYLFYFFFILVLYLHFVRNKRNNNNNIHVP